MGIEIPQLATKRIAWPENVAFKDRGMVRTAIGKQIAAKQRPGGMVDKSSPLPNHAADAAYRATANKIFRFE